ncbi:acyltransferase [Caballeronia sp. ATUFL_F1_KS4A]|uniref:acyltransferase family protein n=1 Tax=Caballeronia sp. ATUFL_F1_KS4A TaxID=2921768 RepID=UPI0020292CF3|nr:acyltransferase [Caballeronia sp. ATUFL_F1_KS4A]
MSALVNKSDRTQQADATARVSQSESRDARFSFPMIDALRGIAALLVVVYHVVELFPWPGYPAHGPAHWLRYGWMGVDLFFVISGFVISLSAFKLLDAGSAERFRRIFVRHRLARIVPLYYLTALLFVISMEPQLFFEADSWKNWLSHLFFIHNFFPSLSGSINGANWSVATEMQFYVLILAIAPWLFRARVPVIIGVSLAISWAWRWFVFRSIDASQPNGAFLLFCYGTQLPGMLDEFAFGIAAARFLRGPHGADLLGRKTRITGAFYLAAAITLAGTAVAWALNPSYANTLPAFIFFRSALGLSCTMLILFACIHSGAVAMRFSAPLRYMGTISYGIYLWHLLVINPLMRFPWLTGSRAMPVVLGVTILLAMISWHFFESPILDKFVRKNRTRASTS